MRTVYLTLTFVLLLLFGCSTKMEPPPLRPSIPTDPVEQTSVYVTPVRFYAALDSMVFSNLCYLAKQPAPDASAYARAMQGRVNCGGEYQCYIVPQEKGDPQMRQIVVGEKNLPGFGPEELTTQLISSLSAIEGIEIRGVPSSTEAYYGGAREPRSLLVRAHLTEMKAVADESASGMGGSGLGIGMLTIWFSGETKEKTGYVRLDVEVVDLKTSRIVAAFPVGGSFTDSYTSSTFFGGIVSERSDFQRTIMNHASRAAFHHAAEALYSILKEENFG